MYRVWEYLVFGIASDGAPLLPHTQYKIPNTAYKETKIFHTYHTAMLFFHHNASSSPHNSAPLFRIATISLGDAIGTDVHVSASHLYDQCGTASRMEKTSANLVLSRSTRRAPCAPQNMWNDANR